MDAIRALEENLWTMWSRFGRGDGCTLHMDPARLWFDTPISTLPYNAVIRFSAVRDEDRWIDALFDHYARRDVPFVWIVHPSAQPGDLAERLAARGLDEAEACPGMTIAIDALPSPPAPPPGITVGEVIARKDVTRFLDLVSWRWEVPPAVAAMLPRVTRAFSLGHPGSDVRAWLACRDGDPVAKAVLHLDGAVAGLYGVATKPSARGLGLARLLTLVALDAARQAGARIAVLHATPAARGLYAKLGFREHAPFRVFAPEGGLRL